MVYSNNYRLLKLNQYLAIIDIILCYFWFVSCYSFWMYYLLNYLPFFDDPSRKHPMYRYIMLTGRLSICFEKTLKGKPFGEFFLSLLLFVLILHSFCVSCTWNVSLFFPSFSFCSYIYFLFNLIGLISNYPLPRKPLLIDEKKYEKKSSMKETDNSATD